MKATVFKALIKVGSGIIFGILLTVSMVYLSEVI